MLGGNVLGIGDAPYAELDQAVKDSLTEYYQMSDMHDYDQLVRACGYFTHRYGKIDRFESLNEYWLATESRIRDDFNIRGVRGRNIDFIKRKSRMKERFRSAEIPVAKGQVVTNIEEAEELIRATGYPVVAKPDIGVGALGTSLLNNAGDLNNFFATKPDVDYIL
jgi:biotin carboxylase